MSTDQSGSTLDADAVVYGLLHIASVIFLWVAIFVCKGPLFFYLINFLGCTPWLMCVLNIRL